VISAILPVRSNSFVAMLQYAPVVLSPAATPPGIGAVVSF